MRFSTQELREFLARQNIPAHLWQLPDLTFETVHGDYMPEVWQAWIDSLRKNAPECLTQMELGGGKTRTVPKWVAEGGDCDNHGLLCLAHAMMGNWINACRGGALVARTVGIAFYVATPRPENRHRAGGHCQCWQIDHDGKFQVWEPADGEWIPWTQEEAFSARFGLAM